MGIRNTIQLKEDVCTGFGKLAVSQGNESKEDSHVAIVHSNHLELMILNKMGKVLQQDVLDLDDLIVDKPDEIQVLWCGGEQQQPTLVIAHTNHLLRVLFDCSTKTWNADTSRMLDQHGWISSLASTDDYIYTGSNEGIWQVANTKDMLPLGKLGNFPTTTICASADYVAAGDEQGAILIFQGSLLLSQRQKTNGSCCCTSMLILQERGGQHVLLAAFNTGSIRLYSLPSMDCLSETAAHIRWITRILPIKGGFASAAEDGFLHIWTLGNDPSSWDIRYLTSYELNDCMITAAAAITDMGILVTAYDRSQMFWLTISGRVDDDDT